MLCSVPFSRVGSWTYQWWPWNEKAFAVCVQPACPSLQSTLYPWNFNINSQNSCVWNQMHFKNPSFLVSLCIYIEFREAHGRLQRSSNLWNIVGKNQFRSFQKLTPIYLMDLDDSSGCYPSILLSKHWKRNHPKQRKSSWLKHHQCNH